LSIFCVIAFGALTLLGVGKSIQPVSDEVLALLSVWSIWSSWFQRFNLSDAGLSRLSYKKANVERVLFLLLNCYLSFIFFDWLLGIFL